MTVVVDDLEAEARSRLVSVRLAQLTLRLMANWRELLIDDCEKAMIMLAVAAISGERLTRGEPIAEEYRHLRPTIPPGDRVIYGNVSSIAAAAGLNRETARRKINQLVEAGLLMRTGNGRYRFDPTNRDVDRVLALVRRQLDAVVSAGNDLMRYRIFPSQPPLARAASSLSAPGVRSGTIQRLSKISTDAKISRTK
jgi:hypothetical protein